MEKPIPFIDLNRFENGFLETVIARVEKLLCYTQFVGGKECDDLESKLRKYCEVPYAVGCANGTDALQIALRTMGVGPGDRVLMPDSNFWAAFEAVVNVGGEPITVDINAETLHLDPNLLEDSIKEFKPKAVIMVHLYGWASPHTQEIRDVCSRHRVALLEDCAQSIGTKFRGAPLISTADIATTSFYPAKVLGASGDAGAVFCRDKVAAETLMSLRNHGRREHYLYSGVGWNSRLGSYEAAFLNVSLEHLEARLTSRRQAIALYRKLLKDTPLTIPTPGPDVEENGYLSVVLCESLEQRTALTERLKSHQIGFGVVYPVPISLQPAAKQYLKHTNDHGISKSVCDRILSLPCFAYIRNDEVERVADVVKSFFV